MTSQPSPQDHLNALLDAMNAPDVVGDYARQVELLREAIPLVNREQEPRRWAGLRGKLGMALRLSGAGDHQQNIEEAVACYHDALSQFGAEAAPMPYVMSHYDLGQIYQERHEGDSIENYETAISHYHKALDAAGGDDLAWLRAQIQYSLGQAYLGRKQGDPEENFDSALGYFIEVASTVPPQEDAATWTMAQVGIAQAYQMKRHGDRFANAEQAIHHWQQALQGAEVTSMGMLWAEIHNVLGNTYLGRLVGDAAENIEWALTHYQQALMVYTAETFPAQWAMVQSNLGTAWIVRVQGSYAENIEQAIRCFEQALTALSEEMFPVQWGSTQTQLGNAHLERVHGSRAENIERAIMHFENALRVRSMTSDPEAWALTQSNLAIAFSNRVEGDVTENNQQAVMHFNQALEVYTQVSHLERWADIQSNLATLFANQVQAGQHESMLLAESHAQQALTIYKLDSYPAERRRVYGVLAEMWFDAQEWAKAQDAFKAAIEAGEQRLAAAYTEAGRQEEVWHNWRLYGPLAYSLLKQGLIGEALIYLEQGKTRLLGEALQDEEKPIRENIRFIESILRMRVAAPGQIDERQLAEMLHEARIRLAELLGKASEHGTNIGLDTILRLPPKHGALVIPVLTSQGSAVIIVPHGITELSDEHVIWLDQFTSEDFLRLLRGSIQDGKLGGWMGAYLRYRDTRTQESYETWQSIIGVVTRHLWNVLIGPIYVRLKALNVKQVIFLPSGGLQLLPLHAAWFQDDDQKRIFLDEFSVSYAPSASVLSICQQRAEKRQGQGALAVGVMLYETLPPLFNALDEAQTVAEIFKTQALLDAEATLLAVQERARKAAYLHFSCHGLYGWGAGPLASGLFLGNGEVLSMLDVLARLDLSSARLVTLSACETGITNVTQTPDEYIGLPAGFLQAGAAAVISSLWEVDDESTRLLMERFYRNYIEGDMDAISALREAQIWLRDQAGPYGNPFYWAAFTLIGAM